MCVCASSVCTNIGKLHTEIPEAQLCQRNVEMDTWKPKGFSSFISPSRSYPGQPVFRLLCHRTLTYILRPSCERAKEKETQFAVQHKRGCVCGGGTSKINNPRVFCIFLN